MSYHAQMHYCINQLPDALCGSIFRGNRKSGNRCSPGSASARNIHLVSSRRQVSVGVGRGDDDPSYTKTIHLIKIEKGGKN